MVRWLDIAPPVVRLAYGATLFEPVPDRQTGYRRLSQLVPVQIDPVGSEDFLYQINRPRTSRTGLPGLTINRLSKWSVAAFQNFVLMFTIPPVQPAQPQAGRPEIACRIELDINTAPSYTNELPHERLGEIFRELIDVGSEIADRGDVP